MNKPKFRALNKKSNEWVYGVPIPNGLSKRVFMICLTLDVEIAYPLEQLHDFCVEVIPETVSQYTGLKGYMDEAFNDPEEKEVARGDVIDIFWEEWPAGYYQENHMIGVVDLDKTGTAWIIKNGKYDWHNPTPIPHEIDGMSISRSLPDEEDLEKVFLHNFNLTSADITILGSIHENPELLNEVSG